MTAENAAMPKVLGLYETHLTVADLKTSTEFYRDVVGLELAASFEERKVTFLWVDDRKTGMLGLWETGTGPLKMRLHIAFRMTADGVLQAPDILRQRAWNLSALPVNR
ncbi:putative enzyme related to lactoylglutathione lyase [Rhizobium leguminosarum]|nr:putative enzyme related to lactoylglutathione lyase [Rhizobium leguminosarum]